MEEAWLINEPKRRSIRKAKGVRKVAKRRRRRIRRNDPDPAKRRRRRIRRNDPDPAKRRRRMIRRNDPDPARRRYRRNDPDPAMTDIIWAAGGFVGTKFVGNMVTPAIGISSPIARLAIKGGIAYFGGNLVIGRFIGRRAGEMFAVGGLVEVISDAVKTYLAPSIPALAAYQEPVEISDVGAYPELEAYPEVDAYPEELEGDEVYS